MRQILASLLVLCVSSYSFSQDQAEVLNNIKDQIEVIDSYSEPDMYYLDPEEFLDKMADHGSELQGFYEHERLKKMVKKVGTRVADIETVFYFWNDRLIYVNFKQRPYFEKKNENGQRILDYSNAFTQYESKHYFDNDKELSREIIGKPLKSMEVETEFVEYAGKMKALLDNKFYNRDMYDTLQGKWVFVQNTDDYIIFEGTIRFNFYNNKFANRLKTRINNNVMECWFPLDERIYRYEIESVNNDVLTLRNLFTKEQFLYTKVE